MTTAAREELIRDLKLWACSPRVPQKAQLVILEAIGALGDSSEAAQESRAAIIDRLGDYVMDHQDGDYGIRLQDVEDVIGMAFDAGCQYVEDAKK